MDQSEYNLTRLQMQMSDILLGLVMKNDVLVYDYIKIRVHRLLRLFPITYKQAKKIVLDDLNNYPDAQMIEDPTAISNSIDKVNIWLQKNEYDLEIMDDEVQILKAFTEYTLDQLLEEKRKENNTLKYIDQAISSNDPIITSFITQHNLIDKQIQDLCDAIEIQDNGAVYLETEFIRWFHKNDKLYKYTDKILIDVFDGLNEEV